jgi:hypothetical protein
MSCDITLICLLYVSNSDPDTHMRCIRFFFRKTGVTLVVRHLPEMPLVGRKASQSGEEGQLKEGE